MQALVRHGPYRPCMRVRRGEDRDRAFILEMARLAGGLDDRPLPSAEDPAVRAVLPGATDLAVIAAGDDERRLGAAWLHFHEPPLVEDRGGALPEVTMAVRDEARGRGLGSRLIAELADEAAASFSALALNVHLRNPAARLYMRNGFRVAGKGRGWYGVAMVRPLDRAQ